MNGNSVILDSNIVIYLSQGRISAENLIQDGFVYYVSIITYMEVMSYKFGSDLEEKSVKDLLGLFNIVYFNERIVDKVIEIRKRYKLKLPDAIICATAIINNFTLLTGDGDFETVKELSLKLINDL